MSIERVTCTIPSDVLHAADAAARKLGRSRSWVVSEALRRFATEPATPLVREPAQPPYSPQFDAARAALRDADLALTPSERLREAETLTDEALRAQRRPRCRQVVQFDSLEDWFAWRKRDLLW